MAQAQTVSLSQFTKTVQAAVKAAVQKHPKFKFEAPQEIAFSYLIRGIPPPPELLATVVTVAEMQAFANEVAAHLGFSNFFSRGPAERIASGCGVWFLAFGF